MGYDSYRKGVSYEHRLIGILIRKGYACVRGPASGRRVRVKRYPDVICLKNGNGYVFEVKYVAYPKTIYIPDHQYRTLKFWEERGGAKPYLVVFVSNQGARVFELSVLEETEMKGKRVWRLNKYDYDKGRPIDDVL